MEQRLEQLRGEQNQQARGFAFQDFVGELFRRAQFEVVPNAGAAKPRQTDIVARRGPETYLVETKWEQAKSDSGDIDALLSRLRRTSSDVIGVFFSYAGFTESAAQVVQHERARPVLLIDGSELDHAVWDNRALVRMLSQKRELLVTHGTVQVGRKSGRPKRTNPSKLPSSDLSFVISDGTRNTEFVCRGGYDKSVFALELPDIDWTPGNGAGVVLDFRIEGVGTQAQLIDFIHELAAMGWVSKPDNIFHGVASWSIQQATTNWHGHGSKEFASALRGWRARYRDIPHEELHHTEEFVYFNDCGLGYFTLFGQIAADRRRFMQQARISFQLMGIPVNDAAFTHLCSRFDADEAFYRPRTSRSVTRNHFDKPTRVTPKALLVQPMDGEDWVVGLVIDNPYHGNHASRDGDEQLPWNISQSSVLVCALRSWHQLKGPKRTYRLWELEWSETSDTTVVRPLADWDDPPSWSRHPNNAVGKSFTTRRVTPGTPEVVDMT
jgi:hypothetical protein